MDKKTSELLSSNLLFLRESLGLTQGNVEKSTGISQSTISKLEKGPKNVKLIHIITLADFYKTNLSDLVKIDLSKNTTEKSLYLFKNRIIDFRKNKVLNNLTIEQWVEIDEILYNYQQKINTDIRINHLNEQRINDLQREISGLKQHIEDLQKK